MGWGQRQGPEPRILGEDGRPVVSRPAPVSPPVAGVPTMNLLEDGGLADRIAEAVVTKLVERVPALARFLDA